MKLQQGDYVIDLTKEQFEELIEIEGYDIKYEYEESITKRIVFNGYVLQIRNASLITPLPFDEFKQRLINTLGR